MIIYKIKKPPVVFNIKSDGIKKTKVGRTIVESSDLVGFNELSQELRGKYLKLANNYGRN